VSIIFLRVIFHSCHFLFLNRLYLISFVTAGPTSTRTATRLTLCNALFFAVSSWRQRG